MAILKAAENQLDDEKQTQAVVRRTAGDIAVGDRGVRLTTFDEAWRFAKVVVSSGLAPKGIDTPEKALIAIQAGAELGFSPMRALAAVTVINGRAGLMGEAALAKIRESGVCAQPPIIGTKGEGDEHHGFIMFRRADMSEAITATFSVADAKTAGLWGRSGPWTQYPDDMLEWRAVARAAKRYFGDVLLGLTVAEELQDYPVEASSRPASPPVEPDPLLAAASVTIPDEPEPEQKPEEAEVVPDPQPDDAPPPDEAALIKAIEKLEGALVSADTIKALDKEWMAAQWLVTGLPEAERARLMKLYTQNLSGFKGEK
jgi:hypothetical protein